MPRCTLSLPPCSPQPQSRHEQMGARIATRSAHMLPSHPSSSPPITLDRQVENFIPFNLRSMTPQNLFMYAFAPRLISTSAQVKLLKCLVDNIVVDISFNQIGGLCTLAFLDSIDRRVGHEHLFKKSIILVGGRAHCGGSLRQRHSGGALWQRRVGA